MKDTYEVDLPLVLMPSGREIYVTMEGDVTHPGTPPCYSLPSPDPGSGPEWDWPHSVSVQWGEDLDTPWMTTSLQALAVYAPDVWSEAQDAIAEALA